MFEFLYSVYTRVTISISLFDTLTLMILNVSLCSDICMYYFACMIIKSAAHNLSEVFDKLNICYHGFQG